MASWVPAGIDILFSPRRRREFGAPHSIAQLDTLPSAPFTSMWIHEWGRRLTGLFASNSAENA
jgi:hypothetical protein